MARASTRTLLPLDRWAELLGISPLHFNQMFSATYGPTSDCGDPFYQYQWQNPEFTAREQIAEAIHHAEQMLANELGYFVLPDWTIDERKQTVRPARPELFSATAVNVRGLAKTVETRWGYVISGGVRAQSLIEAGAAIAFSDEDGDGYAETVTVTSLTDMDDCEIRAFLPGKSGDPAYEIRPIQVTSSGGTATITCKSWQAVDPDKQDDLSAEQPDHRLDADKFPPDADTPYVTTLDLYRIYNDPQTQATLLWEHPPTGCANCAGAGCAECSFDAQSGCIFVRDKRLGAVAYRPASWNADDGAFDQAAFSVGRDPEQVLLWYYSGWQSTDPRISCPLTQMDPFFEQLVVRLSVALLDRNVCSCNNVERFVEYWQTDLSRVGTDQSFQIGPALIENPFGTRRGAWDAWKTISGDGWRIRK